MKRLAAVEVDPEQSNQHEFNAGRIRKELGLKGDPCEGTVEFLFYMGDDDEPRSVPDSYTLYNCRRGKPRSSEWRMYYTNHVIAEQAWPDDLMLLFRPDVASNALVAVIARGGTKVERSLTRQLADREPGELVSDRFVDSKSVDRETRHLLLRVLGRPEPQPAIQAYAFTLHPLFKRSVAEATMPTTAEMAAAAQDILAHLGVTERQPDEFVDLALEAETGLFMAIEEMLGNMMLSKLFLNGDPSFHAFMGLMTSFAQRRRSRRGRSLENHFLRLLKRLKVPCGYQCTTEPGKQPDFIFPSCGAYHDPTYPSDSLRMVGCKTIVRERHTQWIGEAKRIPLKYGLCVDSGLTDALVSRYEGELRFFMPQRLLDADYAKRAIRSLLGSITDLIGELEAAATQNGRLRRL